MKIRIPWRIKEAARILLAPVGRNTARPAPSPATGQSCPVCGKADATFQPLPWYYFEMKEKHGYIHSIFLSETMNRAQYCCSTCGAQDRERLYALYFREHLGRGGKLRDILDIAPSKPLSDYLKRAGAVDYRSADLMAPVVDDRVDIQDMRQYGDGQFQIFICSHVLEHVTDDIAAMRELHRVLAAGGWGICMVPINLGLSETYENPAIVDEAGRWKHFGQGDHVRLYSKDGFVSRLTSVGFRVEQHGISHFGEEIFREHAIHPRSVLYVVHKDA